jgi:beta-lactamase class C
MKYPKYIFTLLFILFALIFIGSRGDNSVDALDSVRYALAKLPSPYKGLIDQYNSFIEAEIDTTHNVGAAVAIVCGDSVVFIKPYGVKEVGTTDSVDIHTVFRMASVSKGFAGVLVAMLDEDKLISLDDKVNVYLPGLQLKDSISTANLSIKNTLNHTTGLVPHTFDNLIEAHISMDEIISRLNEVDIAAAPGKVYGYQNAVFSLIDTILSVTTKSSYSELLDKRIFTPLGMEDASSDYLSMAKGKNIALPHINTKSGVQSQAPNNRYYNIAPAAGVNASISDMSKWLKALLGNRPAVINANVQKQISTPTVQTPLKRRYTRRWGAVDEKYYSLGWRIFKYRGRNIVYHGGYVKGYRAEIAFCPEENVGVVFLQNSPNRLSAESIPTFWDMYFDTFTRDTTSAKDQSLQN